MGLNQHLGLPQWLSSKESACNAGAAGSFHGSRRSQGGGHGNPLQYSCLKNPMGRGAWWATVHRVTKSQTQRLSIEPHRTSTQTPGQKGKRKDAQTIKWTGFLEKPRGSMQVSQQKRWLPGFSECSRGRWPTVQRSTLEEHKDGVETSKVPMAQAPDACQEHKSLQLIPRCRGRQTFIALNRSELTKTGNSA